MDAPVLLTGATGYIGGRLLRRFEDGGRAVRCLVRQPSRLYTTAPTTEIAHGDCLDEASLDRALVGVQCAYYLVHSMGGGTKFADVDRRAAENFARAARRAGVRRVIYLGGLTDAASSLSAHLKSRVETGEILRASRVPVIEFRASVVIGAGSLSFEMIQALVERLPVMICPRWVNTLTQPIAIDDVVAYLEAALDAPGHMEGIFEIGGPEVVSYAGMMRRFASLRGLYRLLLPVPVLTPHLSGLWLALVTPAQARIGRALVEGLKNSTVVRSTAARETFRIAPMPFNAAVVKALDDGAPARLKRDTRTVIVDVPPAQAFAPIRRIGGETGWYFGDVLWQARGWLDRWLGGVGMNRGRRDADACAVGDTIDGWTVEAFEPDRRLRLSANLKLPGHGWLEFAVTPLDTGQRSMIRQTATFDPRGWMGRAYWYAILPVHALIFRGLLRQVARRARPVTAPTLPRVAHRLTAAVAVVAAATLMPATTPAQMGTPVRTVSLVDLDRYTGDWFEIARFPNRFQRQCFGDVRASYTRRADSRIDVVNRCRTADGQTEAHGVARIVDTQTFARLKVRFAPGWLSWLPMVWGDYWIIGLAPDYSWAVVGAPDRNYLWILARTPHLNDASVAAARAAARDNGFDIERLVPTPQSGGGA